MKSRFFLIIALLFSVQAVLAQALGSLSGVVKDPNDALIQGATVTVRNVATNLTRTVVTDEEGRWTIPSLPVGIYSITYEKEGFKKAVVENIEVEAVVPRKVEVRLEVGIAETVVVTTAEQPLVQTENATIARQISGEEITKVPTSTRSFTGLLSSEAGVSAELSPVGVNSNGNISPSVNGTRTTSTSLYFNGIDATNITSNEGTLTDNISPAPETLQEVKLQTSLYDASTGRSGGGNFQLVTKQGGNSLSGSVYYYQQNKAFNSNEFFLKESGNEKPKADRIEAGFTLGGPIVRDKAFFFGGYQYTKANTGLVPTARTRTVLPLALSVLGDNRSKADIAAAFNQFNGCSGSNCLTASDISDVAWRIFNLRNPVTGNFILPSLRPGTFRPLGIVDQTGTGNFLFGNFPNITTRTLQRNNPLVELIQVEPAKFKQNQITARFDGRLSSKNNLSGTLFVADFPGFDPFPDPSSLASPFTLKRSDRNTTLAISDTHVFSSNWTNEFRFGYFYLNNTRGLDEPFLEITNASVGIVNPALVFDDSPATRRLGHFIGRNNIANFSFGGPNDSFNKRKQVTYTLRNDTNWIFRRHNFKFGVEYKRHQYDTNLPEEQATEFEKFDSFTQLLTGNATEADTQYGFTDKSFRFQDIGLYINDTWKVTRRLTLDLGLRYELFMWPAEKNGRIGNFDISPFLPCFTKNGGSMSLCDNPTRSFIVPKNVKLTGNSVIDSAINASSVVDNKHTLNGLDLNNFAPRIGVSYALSNNFVIRGGYGIFYDRPSAAFINTTFSNYPFLREVEITVPSGNVPIANAWANVPTNLPLNAWLPFRVTRTSGASGTYVLRDNTPVFTDPRGTPQGTGCDPSTGNNCIRGNIAETFEFRAVDRNLKTPYVHQWNLGFQYEFAKGFLFEARYVGTAGRSLLITRAFNQGYDLNDPNTPDHIFERLNQAYLAAGAPNGPLNPGNTARERGLGKAFGFPNPALGGAIDLNLANAAGAVINFEIRVPILGFNVPEALLLESKGYSDYHSGQFSLTRRFSKGLQFNVSYTFSKSIDIMSTDPGSTAGSGKPDVPNSGFIVQGDSRNLDNNRGPSDFDRKHRFSTNFVWEIPFGGKNPFLKGWSISGFFQAQSGTPFTIFASEPEITSAAQYTNLARGSGGLYRLGFGRPNFVCSSAKDAIRGYSVSDVRNGRVINLSCFASPLGGFGNLGRNTFRGPSQKRFDLGIAKTTTFNERFKLELGFDIFNLFNTVNFANPNNDLQDAADLGFITNTVGGPRVGQFRVRLLF
ncbi:MAG: TonB-dependent receptor [Pyrinomonadaceae bacterium]|nr:TonB-dependent receptor [Pyrinomonadaceae bacterium]MCX7639480.1 TonB-dependent receptor [Pyrinomonadaceae bacterium]MDW8304469.1 TonB-dependent receptor [Acidobacteriota bacterium]